MDIHDKATRSYNMSKVRNKDTKPELLVRQYLFSHGFRYRKNVSRLPGTPDIVLPKYRTVIFVNGCFWHGHEGCKDFVVPKTRTSFWLDKITSNKERDMRKTAELNQLGWRVLTVWECQLKPARRETTLSALPETIKNGTCFAPSYVF